MPIDRNRLVATDTEVDRQFQLIKDNSTINNQDAIAFWFHLIWERYILKQNFEYRAELLNSDPWDFVEIL